MSIAAIGAIWLRLFLYPKNNESNYLYPVGKASQSDKSCHLHKQWRVHKLYSHSTEKKMKWETRMQIVSTICVVNAGLFCIHLYNKSNETLNKPKVEETYLEENKPISGMFFSSEYVVEEYEYDGTYCLRYDDADANLFDVEIVVDSVTYQSVIESIISGREMVGSLVLNEDLSSDGNQVFTFVPNAVKF